MMMGLTPIKDINYDLVDELIGATEGLNYERVKELLNDPECDVNCPRFVILRSHFGHKFTIPFTVANDTKDLEMFKLYVECERVDVLTSVCSPNWKANFEWKEYYKCYCDDCGHERSVFWLFSEFEELACDRIKRDLVKRVGNLELLPFCVADFYSVSFFHDSLQYMTDVNAKNSYGYTLLNWLAKHNNVNIEAQLAALIERNPDTSIETPDGIPVLVVLQRSSLNRDLLSKLARSLIIQGADIFVTDNQGRNFVNVYSELEKVLPYDSPLFPEIMKAYLLSPKSKNFQCLGKVIETSEEARRIWLELVPIVMKERFLRCEIDEIDYKMDGLFRELLDVKQDFDDEAKLKLIRIMIRRFFAITLEHLVDKLNISEDFFKEHKNALLHECVDSHRFSLVGRFLEVYKADPNSIVGGLHPLFRCKHLIICAELIKSGSNPLYDDGKGKFFNRIRLDYVNESVFESLMALLDTYAIQIDEPNPETGKTFAYILAETGFLCPIENVNLNLVINNTPLFANLYRFDKFLELAQGREIDFLCHDLEGNTFLHRLVQSKIYNNHQFHLLLDPKMYSYFLDEKNNKGETPFDVIVKKAEEEKDSMHILRTIVFEFIINTKNGNLEVFLNRLKQRREENGSLLFDRIRKESLIFSIEAGSLETCKFLIEEYNVDPNTLHFPDEIRCVSEYDQDGINPYNQYVFNEDTAIYLLQKGLKPKIVLLECAFKEGWQAFLDRFVEQMGPDDLKQLKIVLDAWSSRIPSCLLEFVSRADVKLHLESKQLSSLLFSPHLTVDKAQLLIDLGADPLYFAQTKSIFRNFGCYWINSETWYFFKRKGLSWDHLKQMRVFNDPFLKYLKDRRVFEQVMKVFAMHQFGTTCKFQDLNNHQVIGDTERCSICHDEFSDDDDLTILDCKHFFHTACVEYTLERHQDCPYCRTPSPLPSIDDLSLQ